MNKLKKKKNWGSERASERKEILELQINTTTVDTNTLGVCCCHTEKKTGRDCKEVRLLLERYCPILSFSFSFFLFLFWLENRIFSFKVMSIVDFIFSNSYSLQFSRNGQKKNRERWVK